MKSRPPGTSRVEISRNSFAASGTSWTTKIVKAASIFPSFTGERVRESGSHRCVLIRGSKPSGPNFSRQNAEHLLLHVHGDHHTGIADPLCEFPGKEARPAAEIEDPVARFHVPFREPIRAVDEPSQPGIQMCGPFCGKNAVMGISAMGWRTGRYLAGSHTGNMGKKDANSFGNTRAQKKDDQ